MSIYIKNAEMPKCCAECPYETLFSNDIHYCTAQGIPTEIPTAYYWECRPLLCPMSEVIEPHGRLIDAEMLMEYCNNTKAKNISNNDIARFPTVIGRSNK